MSTIEDAQARYDATVTAITNARKAIEDAEKAIHDAEIEQRKAHQDLLAARAAASADRYAPGTRVRHHHFTEITGTVVKNDGTGIAVIADGQDEPRGGYSADEWTPVFEVIRIGSLEGRDIDLPIATEEDEGSAWEQAAAASRTWKDSVIEVRANGEVLHSFTSGRRLDA